MLWKEEIWFLVLFRNIYESQKWINLLTWSFITTNTALLDRWAIWTKIWIQIFSYFHCLYFRKLKFCFFSTLFMSKVKSLFVQLSLFVQTLEIDVFNFHYAHKNNFFCILSCEHIKVQLRYKIIITKKENYFPSSFNTAFFPTSSKDKHNKVFYFLHYTVCIQL